MALVSVGLNFSALADTKCGFDCDSSLANKMLLCVDSDNLPYFFKCVSGSWEKKTNYILDQCDDKNNKTDLGKWDSSDLHLFIDNNLTLSNKGLVVTNRYDPVRTVEYLCHQHGTFAGKNTCVKEYICTACPGTKEWDSATHKCKNPGGGGNVDPTPPPEVKGEIKCGVECKDQTDLYLFCPNEPVSGDSSVFKCENKKWIETDMTAWCCNTTCSAPNDSSLRDVGIWTLDTGHHLYSSSSPIEGGRSYVFYTGKEAAENKQNCTVCPHGTKYDRQENKCK